MSQTVRVATEPGYDVEVGEGILAGVARSASGGKVAVLVDERVEEFHGRALVGLEDAPRLAVPSGESSKSFEQLDRVLEFLADAKLDRSSCLVTFGGGVVSDLGGLAASLFKRGIDVVHAPTTLLAQVDASVGGKTAINLRAGKNLAGTFHQPRAVYCDVGVLATLDDAEWKSGLGEVVKTALIDGADLVELVAQSATSLSTRSLREVADVVAKCVATKARIVSSDPTEQGPRRALNLGHTFAHAIEHAAGYGKIPHGIAVAHGIRLALRASERLGRLGDPELPARMEAILASLGLGDPPEFDPDAALAGFAHDKKGAVGTPELVLPVRMGEMALGVAVDMEFLRAAIR